MRNSVTFVALLLAAGCATASRYTGPIPERSHGRYVFHESVAGSSRGLMLDGEFVVSADTITVTERNAHCEPVQPPDLRVFRYRCGQLTLEFDRRDPARRVAYRVVDYKLSPRSGCIGRRVVVSGSVACDQTADDEVEVAATFSQVLRPTRVAHPGGR